MVKPRILVISGSMGVGKTTILGEASDLLTAAKVPHAAIDLDAISLPLLPEPLSRDVHLRTTAAIHQHCAAAGIDRFLVAVAIDDPNYLGDLNTAFGGDIVVCRLKARRDTMAARLRIREPGMRQDEFVERSRQLDAALDQLGLEDFSLPNDDRHVTAVAAELLRRAGWM